MSSKLEFLTTEHESVADSSRKQGLGSWLTKPRQRRTAFWTIVVVLGFLQVWSHRLLIDHDGVAYLDIAENYARGAWSAAINAYYSPLYSWLMALVMLLKFPRAWEATLLHLVNFAGYLGAYASFEFFLRQLIRKEQGDLRVQDQTEGISESAWHALGLGLFLYSSLAMANLSGHSGQGDPGSTPDIFALLFVYLAAGLLVRMQSRQARAGTYCAFGAVLGFGYLAKTVMFPLSLVFIAAAGVHSIKERKNGFRFLLAPICFALVAGPWIAILSHAEGRFAYGDAGRLTYRWRVGPKDYAVEWGGQTEDSENLVHPPRRLLADPPVYEFATPVAGTFPLWYGSSYWLDGWKFHFSWAGQMRVLHESHGYYWVILNSHKEYLVLLLILMLSQGMLLAYFKTFLQSWLLWFPAIAGLGLYALVRVEPRYVAAFVIMLWISLFAAVRLPGKKIIQQFVLYAVVATVITTSAGLLHAEITDLHSILRNAPSEQMEVAEGLRQLGIGEGQLLATIGIPRDSFYWARLARVRVISEIPTPNINEYWFAPSGTQEKVRTLFAQAGAVAVVTDALPAAVIFPESTTPLTLPGWERIGKTSYYLFRLRTDTAVKGLVADSKISQNRP